MDDIVTGSFVSVEDGGIRSLCMYRVYYSITSGLCFCRGVQWMHDTL